MIQRALVTIIFASLIGACSVGPNQATVPTGNLTGVVTGPNGPVSGATIAVTAADGSQHTAGTTPDGYFEIDRVPAGTIQISVTASGFAPWQSNGLITPNATLTQDIRLNPL